MSAKVLVADDSPVVIHMLQHLLGDAGIEAIEKAVSEDVNLVILDVSMPRMNGYQACRLLKSEPATRSLPVIILTSRDQAGDRFWGLETGADYYITKDSDPQRLLELVRNILAADGRDDDERTRATRTSVDILSRVNELLDRKLYEATILSEMGRVARSLVRVDETFTSVMSQVTRVVDYTVGIMASVDENSLEMMAYLNRRATRAVVEEAQQLLLERALKFNARGFDRVGARVVTTGHKPYGAEETELGGFAFYPVVSGNRVMGFLALTGLAAGRVSAETESFMPQVANQAHMVVENSRLFDRVKNLSIRDSLTGLFNHRHSLEVLGNECTRAARFDEGVCLLMIDIDHFKRINDVRGHQVGNEVLKSVAHMLRGGLRTVDSLGRYGGEEFIAILPQTRVADAHATAERLRRLIADRAVKASGQDVNVTVSMGVAEYPSADITTVRDLVRAADRALYKAKQDGRNRVA